MICQGCGGVETQPSTCAGRLQANSYLAVLEHNFSEEICIFCDDIQEDIHLRHCRFLFIQNIINTCSITASPRVVGRRASEATCVRRKPLKVYFHSYPRTHAEPNMFLSKEDSASEPDRRSFGVTMAGKLSSASRSGSSISNLAVFGWYEPLGMRFS